MPYMLLAPAVFVTLFIVFFPMAQAIFTSFYDLVLWKPNASRFVGFGNYMKLFADPVFWTALGNTAIWIGLTVPLQMGLGLLTALLLNREFPWRGLARALIIIPWALPSVVIALMWRWIYDPNTGVLNDILIYLSVVQSAVPWLADPDLALYAIIATLTWQGFPFFAVMILAGLQGIPRSHYEAASIDGAGKWTSFIYITLPLITPVIFFNLIMQMVQAFQEFNGPYIITQGGPLKSTYLLPIYIYDEAFKRFDMGYASAIAWVLFVIIMALTLIAFWSSRHWVYYAGDKRS